MSDEMEIPEITAEAVQDFINNFIEDSTTHSELHSRLMLEFQFHGRTLQEWLDNTAVNIPDDMDPITYRQISATLARKLQQAHYFYAMCSTTWNTLSASSKNKQEELISKLVAGYAKRDGRRPAADLIKSMANNKMLAVINHTLMAKILKDFWKDRRDALIDARKILETIGMSANTELKYLNASQDIH